MTEILVVTTAIGCVLFVLVVSYTLFRRDHTVSPLIFFLLKSVVFLNAGYIIHYWQYRILDWSIQALMVPSIGLTVVSVAGFATAAAHRNAQQSVSISQDISYHQAMLAACGVFAVVVLYFCLLGYVPLFEGLKTLVTEGFAPGLMNSFRVGRDVYINPNTRYIPLQGFMESVRYYALPVVMVWFLHFFRMGLRRVKSALMLCTSALLLIATGQRWPLMHALMTLLVYLFWVNRPRHLVTRGALRLISVAVLLGLLLSALLGRTSEQLTAGSALLFGLKDLMLRIIQGNSSVPFLSYSIFPQPVGFLWGRSWVQNLIAYLPGPFASFPVTFSQMVTGDTHGFTAPPDFFTEAFINFGWPGVIVICAAWGITLSLVHEAMLRKLRPTRLTSLSLNCLLVTWLGGTCGSGLSCLVGVYIVIAFLRIVLWVSRLALKDESRSTSKPIVEETA